MERYAIYSNILTDSRDYDLTLVSEFKDLVQYDKGRTDLRAFEEVWEKKFYDEKQREIVGEYLVRRIDFK